MVCERWKNSFSAFLEDMGERPSSDYSLDRINNDGNYEPDNCRWATLKQQHYNKCNTVRIGCDGGSYTLRDLAELHGVPYNTICSRKRLGWTDEQLIRGECKYKKKNRKINKDCTFYVEGEF